MFFYEVEGHMPKLSSFGRGKKIRPKKSLTSFLHAALQLFCLEINARNRELRFEVALPRWLVLTIGKFLRVLVRTK